jgi:4-hydroxybenzoate polyprenyltransferase
LLKKFGEKRLLGKKNTVFNRPSSFLSRWRSFSAIRLLQYSFMFASVPMLAYGIKPYETEILVVIIFTIFALYSGFFATLLWNDITDKDIDAIAHPDRPLPAGRISANKMFMIALVFSAFTFLFSYLVSFWCFIFVGAVALFVAFHNKYFKKIIRLPAFSELTTPLQWVIVPIFGFLAIWTVFQSSGDFTITFPIFGYISFNGLDFQNMIILAFFTYFADGAHDLPEGIHDVDGDHKLGVRTYATSFGEKNAARVSFTMFFISGILGILLFIRTILSPIFLVLFLILWIYALYNSSRLLVADKKEIKKMGKIVGQKTFRYFWITYDLIFLDLIIQLLILN